MECVPYMSERYHFAEPRQVGTGSIFVLVSNACEFFQEEHGQPEDYLQGMFTLYGVQGKS